MKRQITIRLAAFAMAIVSLAVTVFAVQQSKTEIKLPIIMYHHISKNYKALGDYVISQKQFESDIKYLKSQGYTTINTSDLLDFVNDKKAPPPKPCMITFDDGFLSTAEYALPLLKKYDMKAVVSIIGKEAQFYTETDDANPEYAYINWQTAANLQKDGTLELQCHTYNMHELWPRNGCSRKYGESEQNYSEALKSDIEEFQSKFSQSVGKRADAFAIPFGAYSKTTVEILQKLGFNVIFTCTEKVNTLTGDPSELLLLGRYNRPSGITSAMFFEKILKECES